MIKSLFGKLFSVLKFALTCIGLIAVVVFLKQYNESSKLSPPTQSELEEFDKENEEIKKSLAELSKIEESKKKAKTEKIGNWIYSEWKDEMTGKVGYAAKTRSVNSVDLSPPYDGPQHPVLSIIKMLDGEARILVSFEKAQILCDGDICGIDIKFDENPLISTGFGMPSDGRRDTLIIQTSTTRDREIEMLASSKKMKIEVPLYQNGKEVLEFDVAGIDLNKIHL